MGRNMKNIHFKLWRFRPRHAISIIVFSIVMVVFMIILVSQSDAYQEARRFSEGDPRLISYTGLIRSAKLNALSGWQLLDQENGGSAEFQFEVDARNGKYTVDVHLYSRAGVWREWVVYVRNE